MAEAKHIGNAVELSPFNKWGKQKVIGHKTEVVRGKTLVTFIWCEVCRNFRNSTAKKNTGCVVSTMTEGTNNVTKKTVFNHLSTPKHIAAEEYARGGDKRNVIGSGLAQPRVDDLQRTQSDMPSES